MNYPSKFTFTNITEVRRQPMAMNERLDVPVFKINLKNEFGVILSLEITPESIANREILDHLRDGNMNFNITIDCIK